MLVQQLVNGLTVGSLYALMALGLTMVYGVLRVLHIAHAAVFTLGAYGGLWTFAATGSFWLALLGAMAIAVAAGLAMERWVYWPLLAKPPIATLIASIGVFIALEEIYRIVAGPEPHSFSVPLRVRDVRLAGVLVTAPQVLVMAVTVALLVALWLFLTRTSLGLALRAVSQDREMAAACAMNVRRIVRLNFALGSALAGAAGVMVGLAFTSVWHYMGFTAGLKGFTAAVLGGIGNIPGAMLGGLLLGLTESLAVGFISPTYKDLIAFVVLIVVLLIRPTGLLGARIQQKV